MRTKYLLLLAGLLSAGLFAMPASAQERVTVESTHSFDQTVSNVKRDVSQGGMMVMAQVDQGNMLSMTGLSLKATLFLIGNPTVGKTLFAQNHGVGLYVPLPIFVYESPEGKTFVSYDKPSSLLQQFNDKQIDMVAGMLDQKIQGLAQMATRTDSGGRNCPHSVRRSLLPKLRRWRSALQPPTNQNHPLEQRRWSGSD